MKNCIYSALVAALLLCNVNTHAQNAIFLTQGRIEFERKLNMWAQIDDDDDESWKELMKKIRPQFKTLYFDLEFNGAKTLYKPGRDNPDNNRLGQEPAEDNVVYTDLDNQRTVTQKNVFELTFLLQDSARQIKWKITNETRNIAGFDCRRANALINDSIYVVAFYTDAITTAGGPESFCGLPGMILGVALPHEHITYFATKVYTENVPAGSLAAPTKGKKTDSKHVIDNLKDVMKDWGKWGQWWVRRVAI